MMAPLQLPCWRCIQAAQKKNLLMQQKRYDPRCLYSQDLSPAMQKKLPRRGPEQCREPASGVPAPSASKFLEVEDSSNIETNAMSRRLEEATDEALLTGGRAGRRAIENAGFSEELKERLLSKVVDAQFRSEHAGAFATTGLFSSQGAGAEGARISSAGAIPDVAGQGTRDLALAQPWTGAEKTEDAVLRMVNDAKKRLPSNLRGQARTPPVDMRIHRSAPVSAGKKAASARDKVAAYTGMGMKTVDKGLSEEEREAVRREFRERFSPGVRALPSTISGLAALANERIEDAIARGQFKNIPRGKGVERDTRADNPFVDTTEYIMNKMIKRQEIVPPWIEKQQELARAANVFRTRLRNDWKRHAARVIASSGGSLQEQMNRAAEYARAEEVHNPRRRNIDEVVVPTNATDDVVMVKVGQSGAANSTTTNPADSPNNDSRPTLSRPFRDSQWEAAERSYMELAVKNLNALTRSYNLMAPELAKKAYFSLERELNNCYADVAPLLADEIKERATRPRQNTFGGSFPPRPQGIFERLGTGSQPTKIYESKAPHYGFKEMWRDLWSRPR